MDQIRFTPEGEALLEKLMATGHFTNKAMAVGAAILLLDQFLEGAPNSTSILLTNVKSKSRELTI